MTGLGRGSERSVNGERGRAWAVVTGRFCARLAAHPGWKSSWEILGAASIDCNAAACAMMLAARVRFCANLRAFSSAVFFLRPEPNAPMAMLLR